MIKAENYILQFDGNRTEQIENAIAYITEAVHFLENFKGIKLPHKFRRIEQFKQLLIEIQKL